MRSAKGKVIVSLNDHPDIRRCFEDFQMETLQLDYTVGGAASARSAAS
jgi:DNA adenine methylase